MNLLKVFLITLLTFGLFGYSAEVVPAQKDISDRAAQTATERKIRKEILSLPYYGVFDAISYEIDGQIVTLKGYVTRPLTKQDAEAQVREIDRVADVINKIEVLPLSSSDDRIRVRIYNAMKNSGSLYRYLLGANPSIRIIVNNGRVKLEGFVNFETDKTLAYVAAREIFGVFDVENNLKVVNREKKSG